MDYAELAKRLRDPERYVDGALDEENVGTMALAADAIEALTSPPDEAQVDVYRQASEDYHERESHGEVFDPDVHHGATLAGLNAAHRIRVKKEAKA